MAEKTSRSFFKSLFDRKIYPKRTDNGWFYPLTESGDIFNSKDLLKDFLEIPELNAIINIRARAMASWKLSILSKKTGKEVTNNETIARIIRTPNWFQSQTEFWKHSSILRDIYGNEFIYFLTPLGMPNSYKGMFSLDPSKVLIKYNSKTLYFNEQDNSAVSYYYKVGGKEIPLDKSKIIHLNDNRVQHKDFLRGTSKIENLQAPLNNIREAYKKRNIILRMPIGILSNGQNDAIGQAVPMQPKEKESTQKALKLHGADPIITNLAVKYNDMTINAGNMGLFEEVREDIGRLCDAYGVSYAILANAQVSGLGSKGTELKESRKQMYEDTIIPDAEEKLSALNLMFDGKTWEVVGDFHHLPVFAEDQKQRAISLKQMVEALSKALTDGAITIEQYQNELKRFGI